MSSDLLYFRCEWVIQWVTIMNVLNVNLMINRHVDKAILFIRCLEGSLDWFHYTQKFQQYGSGYIIQLKQCSLKFIPRHVRHYKLITVRALGLKCTLYISPKTTFIRNSNLSSYLHSYMDSVSFSQSMVKC